MKIEHLLICGVLLLGAACSPKVSTTGAGPDKPGALAYDETVYIFNAEDSLPIVEKELGRLKVGDSGFSTNCGYELVMRLAEEEARKAGGNALQIISHKTPDFWSSCHRIEAKVLLVKVDSSRLSLLRDSSALEEGADYALIHVYRSGGFGAALAYDLYLGDTKLCRVKNNTAETIKVNQEKWLSLWAKTESKTEIPIEIEFGKEYYISCSLSMGIFVGRPVITIANPKTGKKEFESIIAKQKKK